MNRASVHLFVAKKVADFEANDLLFLIVAEQVCTAVLRPEQKDENVAKSDLCKTHNFYQNLKLPFMSMSVFFPKTLVIF